MENSTVLLRQNFRDVENDQAIRVSTYKYTYNLSWKLFAVNRQELYTILFIFKKFLILRAINFLDLYLLIRPPKGRWPLVEGEYFFQNSFGLLLY